MIAGASKPSSGVIASIIGVLDADLRRQFSRWRTEIEPEHYLGPPARRCGRNHEYGQGPLQALGVVLAGGFLLLVSLVISSAMSAAGTFMSGVLAAPRVCVTGFELSWSRYW